MSEENDIPKHWKRTTLGNVLSISSGNGLTKSNRNDEGKYLVYGGNGVTGNHSEFLFEEEKLIIGRVGVHCGNAYITKPKSWVTDNAFVVSFNEKEVGKRFLLAMIKYLNLNKYSSSTAQPVISQSKIYPLQVALPPLSEQTAIVSKLEELLSDLENGNQQLLTAQQQLKTYRQSLLKWAFEGKLTNKSVNGELPKGWKWVKVDELKDKMQYSICAGPFGTIFKAKDFRSVGVPIIFLRHVKAGGYNTRKPNYMDKRVWEKLFKPYSVYGGELLITKLGDPPGECAIYPSDIGPAMVTPDVIKMNVNEKLVLTKYLMHYFNSEISRKELQNIAFGSTRLRITLPIFKKLSVPYCRIKEQEKVVQEIEKRFSVCDKIEEVISASLQQAEGLKQSILNKAFEGRLVSVRQEKCTKQQDKRTIPVTSAKFPRTIEGIAATDLQAGIISMVIDLHEKNPEYLDKLSHVKCEKISDLVERKLGISLGRVAMKDAAGPDDFPHLKKVEHRANKAGFFRAVALQPIGHTYKPMRNMNKAIDKVRNVLSETELKEVDQLLTSFVPFELAHAELVATIFAGWNNLLLSGKQPTDEEIVYESRENWSRRKLSIPRENFFKTLKWMKEHKYIPEGKGQIVMKKEEVKPQSKKKTKRK